MIISMCVCAGFNPVYSDDRAGTRAVSVIFPIYS